MAETVATKQSKGAYKYLCGVPNDSCGGGTGKGLSASIRKNVMKVHNTSSEAMACYKRYLLKSGYEQLSSRVFQRPGEPARFLTKQSRFGAKMRPGKAGRNMPNGRRTGGACTSM